MAVLGDHLVTGFNNAMKNFLQELTVTFPEQTDVKSFYDNFDALVSLMPAKPAEVFMEAVKPHKQLLLERDPRLFDELDFPGINFRQMWEMEDVTDNTRDAIWQHLSMLYMLGGTAQGVTPELVQTLDEKIAACIDGENNSVNFEMLQSAAPEILSALASSPIAENFAGMEGASFDPETIMSMAQGIMSSVGGAGMMQGLEGMEGMDVSGLMGLLQGLMPADGSPAPRRPRPSTTRPKLQHRRP
jgi:hypothetical protein